MYPYSRLRRNRSSSWVRGLVRETSLNVEDIILPVFVKSDGTGTEVIKSLYDVYRYTIDDAIDYIFQAKGFGIGAIALFPVNDDSVRSDDASEAYNPDNLMCQAIRNIRREIPDIAIITDVALDPYTTHGHDGLLSKDGIILNDETVEVLYKQALVQAAAGSDIIAPSDMMDGRVGVIRKKLDDSQFQDIKILSYSTKYLSSLYTPFRDAINVRSGKTIDKSTYQVDFHNKKEVLLEVEQDIQEGADMVMIKPAGAYLDIIYQVSERFNKSLFAYQVSGEYAMIKCAEKNGIIDGDKFLYESLVAIKRAGANAIITYAGMTIAKMLQNKKM